MSNKGIDYTRQQALSYTSYNYETSKTLPAAYGVMSGNFDGAGGSFGVIQFNWKSGTIQPILRDLINDHPADMQAAFTSTADYNTIVDVVLNRTTANQILWGDSISDPTNKHKVIEPWNTYFVTLGSFQSCQDRQMQACQNYFNTANTWASDFGLWSRRGYALCFDNAVQYGGMNSTCHTDIMNFIAALPSYYSAEFKELKTMRYFAWRVCQDHQGTYYQSALDRRNSIANGSGNVYGYPVSTAPYDLNLEPNGLLAIPAAKIPHWIRNIRIKRG
jgi:hypothetical protein